MRQSQKSNRTRSRGRKPSNPLSRSYDSNGPDVKIRGTASHIAEKYQSLARDALASGDMVMSENYYQHAEHYLRIIAAAQTSSRDESRPGNNDDQPNGDASFNRRNGTNNAVITGEEPQPDVALVENTASELDVVNFKPIPGEGDQPDIEDKSESTDEDGQATPARRRRRTTYRSRKRTGTDDKGAEKGDSPAAEAPKAPKAPKAAKVAAAEE